MKNLLSILILSIFPFSLLGESYETFYEDGSLKIMGKTSNLQDGDGWFLGKWTDFSNDGEVTSKGSYKYSKGIYKIYNEKERLVREGRGIDGLAEGEWVYYFDNGAIKTKGTVIKDKKHGLWTSYYEDGSLYAEFNYLLNKIEGRAKTYHRNGALCSNNLFKNSKLIGSAKKFYNNGQIEYEQAYVDGKKHGLGARVDSDGTYLWVAKYENGKWLDKESRAKNTFLFRKMEYTKPQCGRHLEPINAPKIRMRNFIQHGGCVVLDFTINQEGMTEDIKVRSSVPDVVYKNSFEVYGKKFIKNLEYPIPRNKEGKPISMEANYRLHFKGKAEKPNYIFPGCELD